MHKIWGNHKNFHETSDPTKYEQISLISGLVLGQVSSELKIKEMKKSDYFVWALWEG